MGKVGGGECCVLEVGFLDIVLVVLLGFCRYVEFLVYVRFSGLEFMLINFLGKFVMYFKVGNI